ncbi:MAG: ABC transporter permease [Pyrinomonadaceae bacterium]
MRSPFQNTFGAVFKNEVLLNSKRVAPYALIVLFTAHAILWWGWSAAATFGWATNGDFNIVRNLQGFSFILGLPIFTAVIMGDPVIRDFRIGIDPLIFSRPISRAAYVMGKFWGNFFVLVCCQAAFALTMLALQWFPTSRLLVLPVRVWPYFKHFFFFVVVSHLFLAAVYFTVGTLTRKARMVYGAAVAFYPLYIAYQVVLLKSLPPPWSIVLDPMLLNAGNIPRVKWEDAAWVNQIVVSYSADMMMNRVFIVAVAAVFLMIVCLRFAITAADRNSENFSVLNISTANHGIHYDRETILTTRTNEDQGHHLAAGLMPHPVQLPTVARDNDGLNANLRKLYAATVIEIRLLRSERSLVVLIPLTLLLSFLALPFSGNVSGVSRSAAFAGSTARGLLLFLLGVIVFYLGEAMHRDREVRVEPILWSKPMPNTVLLLPKFMATFLVSLFLLVLVGTTAMLTQVLRGHTPVEISAYAITYSVILVPSLAFMAAASLSLNVLLRDKYLTYIVTIAVASGLFYLYSQGYNHWLYNPVLYGLWTEADMTWSGVRSLVTLRLYCIGLTLLNLLFSHFFFGRPGSIRRLR